MRVGTFVSSSNFASLKLHSPEIADFTEDVGFVRHRIWDYDGDDVRRVISPAVNLRGPYKSIKIFKRINNGF